MVCRYSSRGEIESNVRAFLDVEWGWGLIRCGLVSLRESIDTRYIVNASERVELVMFVLIVP